MEPGKNNNSETSKKSEDDLHEEHKAPKEDDMGVGRSYECAFCKRGFTNAQALGGHMNIHRKDKAAKAKSKPRDEPAASVIRKFDYSRYFPGEAISSQINHDNYKVYLPSPNPSFQTLNSNRQMMMDLGPNQQFGLTDDLDENLSLRIGLTSSSAPTNEEIGGEQNAKENDEVDLELRLGHDP